MSCERTSLVNRRILAEEYDRYVETVAFYNAWNAPNEDGVVHEVALAGVENIAGTGMVRVVLGFRQEADSWEAMASRRLLGDFFDSARNYLICRPDSPEAQQGIYEQWDLPDVDGGPLGSIHLTS